MDNYTWHIEREAKTNRRLAIASYVISGFALILSIYSICSTIGIEKSIKSPETPKKVVLEHNSPTSLIIALDSWGEKELNDENILAFMEFVGIEHSHIALAQMKLESGHYKSKLAKENNNYFGMKHPSRRATTSLGSKNGFASYKNWVYSVLDYALWQRTYASNLSEKEYLDSLSTYAEDKKYIAKVKKLAKNLENRK